MGTPWKSAATTHDDRYASPSIPATFKDGTSNVIVFSTRYANNTRDRPGGGVFQLYFLALHAQVKLPGIRVELDAQLLEGHRAPRGVLLLVPEGRFPPRASHRWQAWVSPTRGGAAGSELSRAA